MDQEALSSNHQHHLEKKPKSLCQITPFERAQPNIAGTLYPWSTGRRFAKTEQGRNSKNVLFKKFHYTFFIIKRTANWANHLNP